MLAKKSKLKSKTPKETTPVLSNKTHLSFRECYKLSFRDLCSKMSFWILSQVHLTLQWIPHVPEINS